jgi:Cu(I)/Ag(I) efflux system protein CusF
MKQILVVAAVFTVFLAGCAQEVEELDQQDDEIAQVEEEQVDQEVYTGRGVVTAVDRELGDITIDHTPIPGLEWPAGTHQFDVPDVSAIEDLEVGDAVRFIFAEDETGEYVVQALQEE